MSAGSCLSSKLPATALPPHFSAIPQNLDSVLAEHTPMHSMKFQKNIFVKLAVAGELFNNGIYFDLDAAIIKLLILHEKRDKEGKCITFLTEMCVGTNSG